MWSGIALLQGRLPLGAVLHGALSPGLPEPGRKQEMIAGKASREIDILVTQGIPWPLGKCLGALGAALCVGTCFTAHSPEGSLMVAGCSREVTGPALWPSTLLRKIAAR